jgi:hypothetical protein
VKKTKTPAKNRLSNTYIGLIPFVTTYGAKKYRNGVRKFKNSIFPTNSITVAKTNENAKNEIAIDIAVR